MAFNSAVSMGPRVQVHFEGKGRTKQAPTQETDINYIMAKYVKTGTIEHFAKHGGEYGFASSIVFHEAMNVVAKADSMFAELPALVRRRFNEEPGEFLEFVQNPENQKEMIELGLAEKVRDVDVEPVVPVPDAESASITPEVVPDAGIGDPAIEGS